MFHVPTDQIDTRADEAMTAIEARLGAGEDGHHVVIDVVTNLFEPLGTSVDEMTRIAERLYRLLDNGSDR